MRRTIGSCSARPRPPPLVDAGSRRSLRRSARHHPQLHRRPSAPLAVAIIKPLRIRAQRHLDHRRRRRHLDHHSLPSTCHSPVSSMMTSMRWPAPLNAFSTASRRSSGPCFRSSLCFGSIDSGNTSAPAGRPRLAPPIPSPRWPMRRSQPRASPTAARSRPRAPASIRSCAPNPPRTAKHSSERAAGWRFRSS